MIKLRINSLYIHQSYIFASKYKWKQIMTIIELIMELELEVRWNPIVKYVAVLIFNQLKYCMRPNCCKGFCVKGKNRFVYLYVYRYHKTLKYKLLLHYKLQAILFALLTYNTTLKVLSLYAIPVIVKIYVNIKMSDNFVRCSPS